MKTTRFIPWVKTSRPNKAFQFFEPLESRESALRPAEELAVLRLVRPAPLAQIAAAVLAAVPLTLVMAQEPFRLQKVQPSSIEVLTAREPGLLETLDTALGAEVKAGDLLGKLDHERQLHAYLTAKIRSESQAMIEIAQGELREKNALLSETLTRFRKRQASEEDVERAQGQAQSARGKLSQARMVQEIGKLELALAEKLLENRYIRTPISGTVVEISKPRGSRVNQGDPILTVADLTSATSEFLIPKNAPNSLTPGSSLPVRIAGSEVIRQAKIHSVAAQDDGTQRVRIIFDNLNPQTPLAAQIIEAILPPGVKAQPMKPPQPEGTKAEVPKKKQ